MITFDTEYSVVAHFELDPDEALEQGGKSIDTVKRNCTQLSDWILAAISEFIELGENDAVTVMPISLDLRIDGKKINLDSIPEDYDVTVADDEKINFTEERNKGE